MSISISVPSASRVQIRVRLPASSSEMARRLRRSVMSWRYSPMLSSHSTVSATTFSRSARLAIVATETSASVPAPLPPVRLRTAPRRKGYPVKIVTPVATVRLLAPSTGGRRSP